MKKSVLITLVLFIIILVGSNIYLLSHYNKCSCEIKQHNEKEATECKCYVTQELGLSSEQSQKYEQIKKSHQEKASVIIDSLHVNQELMMDYISKNNSQKETLDYFKNKITYYQSQLFNQSLSQFLELKSIINPDQMERANEIFRELFVCRPTCEHNHNHLSD